VLAAEYSAPAHIPSDDDVEQLDQVVELAAAPMYVEPTCDDCGRRMHVFAAHDNGLRFCHACIALSPNLRAVLERHRAGAAPPPPSKWKPRDEDSHQGNPKSEIGSFKRPPPEQRAPKASKETTRELWGEYTREVPR
jgi:hypothetical protein